MPIEMDIGYLFDDELPEFESIDNSIDVDIGDSKHDVIDNMGLPIYDFGVVYIHKDDFDNMVVTAFDNGAVSRFACFTTEGDIFLFSNVNPIKSDMIDVYQGKTIKELQSQYGEFHCYIDIDGIDAPAYITQSASIVYFDLNNDVVNYAYSINIFNGSVNELSR